MSHYYKTDKTLKSERKKIKYDIKAIKFEMITDNGVFSKDGLDFATRFLLEEIEIKDNAKVLDIGCGYGAVGVYVKTCNPSTSVTMVDINERAIELSKENTSNLDVLVFESNTYESVEGKFDLIISNPPIHAGKKVVHDILLKSVDYLTKDGELWFVMNKKHGYNSAIKLLVDVFDDAETIRKKKGFNIVRCINSAKTKI